jgi:hypothetical protein
MKFKLRWTVPLLLLLMIAGYVVPRLKYWLPSLGPGVMETARAEQATPEGVVTAVFQTVDQGGREDDPNVVMTDRLNTMHLIAGKNAMTAEEQKFDALFWDNKRSSSIYSYLRDGLTREANITAINTSGSNSVISVAVKDYPKDGDDWVDTSYTVELKKRGPNWYVDELKTPKWPGGVYAAYKQKMGIP